MSSPKGEVQTQKSQAAWGLGVRPPDAQAAIGNIDYHLCPASEPLNYEFNFPRTLGLCRQIQTTLRALCTALPAHTHSGIQTEALQQLSHEHSTEGRKHIVLIKPSLP